MSSKSRKGLILTGGGSRGAYQVGVLKGLIQIMQEEKIDWPFEVLLSSSAGAINLTTFLSEVDWRSPEQAIKKLEETWLNLNSSDIYKTNWSSVLNNGLNWIKAISMKGGGLNKKGVGLSLLNPEPLNSILKSKVNFKKLNNSLQQGFVDTIGINALSYADGYTKTYFNSTKKFLPNKGFKRETIFTDLKLKHLLASAAIPILFPPVKIQDSFHCDGSVRDYAPFSPAIHFGCDKILMITVRQYQHESFTTKDIPSTARIFNMLLESLMQDSIEIDLEKLNFVNELIGNNDNKSGLKMIDARVQRPGQRITDIARQEFSTLPSSIKYLLNGLGPIEDVAELASFLLFERNYIEKLIKLGHTDIVNSKPYFAEFMNS